MFVCRVRRSVTQIVMDATVRGAAPRGPHGSACRTRRAFAVRSVTWNRLMTPSVDRLVTRRGGHVDLAASSAPVIAASSRAGRGPLTVHNVCHGVRVVER